MNTTAWWLVILGLIIITYIGYDIFAMVHWGSEKTISSVLLNDSKKRPIIAYAIGFMFGLLTAHLFWTQGN